MPARAGIQCFRTRLDSRFRGNDKPGLANIYAMFRLSCFKSYVSAVVHFTRRKVIQGFRRRGKDGGKTFKEEMKG
jgi:hypothetical protein